MTVYDVIHLVKDMDNLDKLDNILRERCFQTSVMSPEVKQEMKEELAKIRKMGETKVYAYIKEGQGIK